MHEVGCAEGEHRPHHRQPQPAAGAAELIHQGAQYSERHYFSFVVCVSTMQEMNELVQLFVNIGESLPQQHRQPSGSSRPGGIQQPHLERENSGTGAEILSLLDSCHLAIDEICITVSTPLCTALRFSTSRIDMLIMNSGGQPSIPGQHRFVTLHRRERLTCSTAIPSE